MHTDYMLDLVLPSTARVLRLARQVYLNEQAFEAYSMLVPVQELRNLSFSAPYHYDGPPEQLLNFVVALDAINFGSGYSQHWPNKQYNSIYKTTAAGMKRLAESRTKLDGFWMQQVDRRDLAQIFAVPADFPLMGLFAQSLNELGTLLVREFDGRPVQMVESANHSAHVLVELLAGRVAAFHDVAEYACERVYFLKRAQILCADLYQAFEGKGWGYFVDIDGLTCFADNAVPKVLHVDGLLEYAPELEERIRSGELIEPGSPAEIELRAAAVQAVERLRQILQQRGEAILSYQLDSWLWHRSQAPEYKAINSHKTQSRYY